MKVANHPLSIVTALPDVISQRKGTYAMSWNVATLHICEAEETASISTSQYDTQELAFEAAKLFVPINHVPVSVAEFEIHREYQQRYWPIRTALYKRWVFIEDETDERYTNESAIIQSILETEDPGSNYPACTVRRTRALALVAHLDHLQREDQFWSKRNLEFLYNWTDDANE